MKNENSIQNADAVNGIAAPVRDGYTFAGWATEAEGPVVYAVSDVMTVPNGTILYAVWKTDSNIE
jgi:uncharacterized repeat protein (TIGR02543 family)